MFSGFSHSPFQVTCKFQQASDVANSGIKGLCVMRIAKLVKKNMPSPEVLPLVFSEGIKGGHNTDFKKVSSAEKPMAGLKALK